MAFCVKLWQDGQRLERVGLFSQSEKAFWKVSN